MLYAHKDESPHLEVQKVRGYCKEQPYLQYLQKEEIPPGYLSDAFKEEIPRWKPEVPVVIRAQTGAGKTRMVLTDIFPTVLEHGTHMIILSNRVMLRLQQRKDLRKCLEDACGRKLYMEDLLYNSTLDNIRILTYHSLPGFVNNPDNARWLEKVEFVVADEIHFLYSDSLFCDSVDRCLEALTSCFKQAIRIYISATPENVLNSIAAAEYQARPMNMKHPEWFMNGKPEWLYPFRMLLYTRPNDYSWCNLHFFDDLEDLVPKIEADPKSKWLVFVDSKKRGKAFKERLGAKASYLDAEHKEGETFEEIAYHERFGTQALITTTVLDNGISIKMDDLKHVVIMSRDRTTALQCLGRKRRKEGETVELYVHRVRLTDVYQELRDCERYLDWYEKYDEVERFAEENPRDYRAVASKKGKLAAALWKDPEIAVLRNFFTVTNGNIYPNRLAREHLEYRKAELERIYSGETTFEKEVYKWLEKTPPDDRRAIDDFYEMHKGLTFDIELQAELRAIIVEMMEEAGHTEAQPTRVGTLGAKALNNRLETLRSEYRIVESEDGWNLEREEPQTDR